MPFFIIVLNMFIYYGHKPHKRCIIYKKYNNRLKIIYIVIFIVILFWWSPFIPSRNVDEVFTN